jgi:precorrin isomerase
VGAVRRAPSPEDVLRITITNAEGMPAALAALQKGATIVTDTNMACTGINKVFIWCAGARSECRETSTRCKTIAQNSRAAKRPHHSTELQIISF